MRRPPYVGTYWAWHCQHALIYWRKQGVGCCIARVIVITRVITSIGLYESYMVFKYNRVITRRFYIVCLITGIVAFAKMFTITRRSRNPGRLQMEKQLHIWGCPVHPAVSGSMTWLGTDVARDWSSIDEQLRSWAVAHDPCKASTHCSISGRKCWIFLGRSYQNPWLMST